MTDMAIASHENDCMDAGGSECLEHILERVFRPFAESKFLSLGL